MITVIKVFMGLIYLKENLINYEVTQRRRMKLKFFSSKENDN